MDWPTLLSAERPGGAGDTDDMRSPFERDIGRILFSNAFRRLHNKTQVFPLPENDHVHSRLTHTIEVASVGRTLGTVCGRVLRQRHDLGTIEAADIGSIVEAACLAHDIGNPPFGHAGEDAIGHFFAEGPGRPLLAGLSGAEADDLRCFEGNAQGFRVLTRLALSRDRGGMRLSAAVLGAFAKYPQASAQRRDPARPTSGKKHGYCQDDAAAARAVAEACGLHPVPDRAGAWCRHPLAFLMEAADDLCYSVLDLEDAAMLRLIESTEAVDCFAELLGEAPAALAGRPVSALRARAIGLLVRQVVEVFLAHESALLAGRLEQPLANLIPAAAALQRIYNTNMRFSYRAPQVLALEQAGYNVIGGLLANLCASVAKERNPRFVTMLGEAMPPPEAGLYRRLLAVTDFVSGMTDRYAVRLYHQITGIAIESV